jgi:hypothetical protein
LTGAGEIDTPGQGRERLNRADQAPQQIDVREHNQSDRGHQHHDLLVDG